MHIANAKQSALSLVAIYIETVAVIRYIQATSCRLILISRRKKAISDVKMMRICYLSVVAVVCMFGYGAAQKTTAPPDLLDDDDHDPGLYLSKVTSPHSPPFMNENRFMNVYTLSLEMPELLKKENPGSDYTEINFYTVKSPEEALAEANKALHADFLVQPTESEEQMNHKATIYAVSEGFNHLRKFLEVLENAIIRFEYTPKQRQ